MRLPRQPGVEVDRVCGSRLGRDRSTQAEKYLGELHAAMQRLVADADRGRACDEIRQGYRRFAIERHVILYRAEADGLDVIRVPHQRMDPDLHL